MRGAILLNSKPSHKPYRPRPKWRNPGKAWEPRTKAQERKHKTPRAFSIRGEWKYGEARTEQREKQVKKSVTTMIAVNLWFSRLWRKVGRFFGIVPFHPDKINPEIYQTEVTSEQNVTSHESTLF